MNEWHDNHEARREYDKLYTSNALQAASEAQLAMLNMGAAQASITYGTALANYCPWPPHVPQGWADWFAHGDELN